MVRLRLTGILLVASLSLFCASSPARIRRPGSVRPSSLPPASSSPQAVWQGDDDSDEDPEDRIPLNKVVLDRLTKAGINADSTADKIFFKLPRCLHNSNQLIWPPPWAEDVFRKLDISDATIKVLRFLHRRDLETRSRSFGVSVKRQCAAERRQPTEMEARIYSALLPPFPEKEEQAHMKEQHDLRKSQFYERMDEKTFGIDWKTEFKEDPEALLLSLYKMRDPYMREKAFSRNLFAYLEDRDVKPAIVEKLRKIRYDRTWRASNKRYLERGKTSMRDFAPLHALLPRDFVLRGGDEEWPQKDNIIDPASLKNRAGMRKFFGIARSNGRAKSKTPQDLLSFQGPIPKKARTNLRIASDARLHPTGGEMSASVRTRNMAADMPRKSYDGSEEQSIGDLMHPSPSDELQQLEQRFQSADQRDQSPSADSGTSIAAWTAVGGHSPAKSHQASPRSSDSSEVIPPRRQIGRRRRVVLPESSTSESSRPVQISRKTPRNPSPQVQQLAHSPERSSSECSSGNCMPSIDDLFYPYEASSPQWWSNRHAPAKQSKPGRGQVAQIRLKRTSPSMP